MKAKKAQPLKIIETAVKRKGFCSKCSIYLTNTKINKTAEATYDSVICCTILVVDDKIKKSEKKKI